MRNIWREYKFCNFVAAEVNGDQCRKSVTALMLLDFWMITSHLKNIKFVRSMFA